MVKHFILTKQIVFQMISGRPCIGTAFYHTHAYIFQNLSALTGLKQSFEASYWILETGLLSE